MTSPPRVVLDANVLYPFVLRDTLLQGASVGLFQPYWSEQILEEMHRNLVTGKHQMPEARATRLRDEMRSAFPGAMVVGHEPWIAAMRNDPKDRHVVAVAAEAGASLIVTSNLRDFQPLPSGLEAQSPDAFLCELLDREPELVVALLRKQASLLKKPPLTFEELLLRLARLVPRFVVAVEARR